MDGGMKKVLSRMGISTLESSRTSHLFEVVGLDGRLCREFFEDASHYAEATSLETVIENYLHNHTVAFDRVDKVLRDSGYFRYRKEGERHTTSPELLHKLRAVVKDGDAESRRAYEELASSREPAAVRDLMAIVFPASVAIEAVEPTAALMRRFRTQALSVR